MDKLIFLYAAVSAYYLMSDVVSTINGIKGLPLGSEILHGLLTHETIRIPLKDGE
jgi:hypothetical protein